MADLPEPLTPPECDLSDFQYMELDVRRLRDSKFSASVDGESFRAGILLWCAAWHQVPAGSLPDDDIELANLAGYGRVIKEWKKVRTGALYGFVKCADGRLYHPIIAEKARAAYNAKLKHAYDKFCDRMRKDNARRAKENLQSLSIPSFEQWKSGEYLNGIPKEKPKTSTGIPPEASDDSTGVPPENALKGNGEGTEREQNGEGTSLLRAGMPTESFPPEIDGPRCSAGEVSKVMRGFGIMSNPGDLRLIAIAQQGVTADTVKAACEAAKKAKPNEAIPPAYVFSIIERWAKEAATINVQGARPPATNPQQSREEQQRQANEEAMRLVLGNQGKGEVIDV